LSPMKVTKYFHILTSLYSYVLKCVTIDRSSVIHITFISPMSGTTFMGIMLLTIRVTFTLRVDDHKAYIVSMV